MLFSSHEYMMEGTNVPYLFIYLLFLRHYIKTGLQYYPGTYCNLFQLKSSLMSSLNDYAIYGLFIRQFFHELGFLIIMYKTIVCSLVKYMHQIQIIFFLAVI